jgi:hypothetical protein
MTSMGMTDKPDNSSDKYLRLLAKAKTVHHLLFALVSALMSPILFIFAFILFFHSVFFWPIILLSLASAVVATHTGFMIAPVWMTRAINRKGGRSRWATYKEIKDTLYGPAGNTAP